MPDRQRIAGLYFQMSCQLALLLLYLLSNKPRKDITLDRPEQVIDLRNAFEPIALLNISQLCREMKTNDTMEIRVEDSDFHGNLLRLLHCFPVRVLSDNKCAGSETGWQVIIQKHIQEEHT
jgi:TusA-related sulfurtransferase